MLHKDWDISEHVTGRFHKDPDTGLELPIMGATLQNGLNDIEPDGSFVPCDMGIDAVTIGVTTHKVKRGRYGQLRLGDTTSNKPLIKIKDKDLKGISLQYINGGNGSVVVGDKKASFPTSDGVGIDITPSYKGVKVELVLSDPTTAPLEYPFSIKTYGQNYTYEIVSGSIIATGEDGKKITLHAPYAIDPNGDVGQVGYVFTGVVNNLQTFKKVVNETWLRQAAAPVRLDPNVTIEDGVDGGIIEDTFMNSTFPTINYGSDVNLALNNYYEGAGHWTLARVGLSGYSDTTPVSGKFLLRESVSNVASVPCKCTKILRAWVATIATWNIYDTALNWQAAGAQGALDRAASTECTFDMTSTGTVDVPITVPTLAEWLTTNYGVVMDGNSAPVGEYVHAGSSEHSTVPIQFYYEYTEGEFSGYPFFFGGGHY